MVSTLAFGAIGFADDYIKVIHRRNLGLTAMQKMGLQILTAVAIARGAAGHAERRHLLHPSHGAVSQALSARPVHTHVLGAIPHLGVLAFLPFVIFVTLSSSARATP